MSPGARRAVASWLGLSAGWVFAMVVLGGVTRLTRSGLSMTDWKFTGERWPQNQVCCSHAPVDALHEARVLVLSHGHCHD